MKELRLEVKTSWRTEQPDGSNCFACKDEMYLDMWRLMISIDGKFRPTDKVICDQCKKDIKFHGIV